MNEAVSVRFTGAAGNSLNAVRRGSGPPVILLHGGGQTHHAWDGAAKALSQRGWCTYAVDHRGHGESDWVSGKGYRFRDFGDDLICIAESLAGHMDVPPVVIGASLGGIAAMLAAHGRPELFRAIILVDVTPRMEARGIDRILTFMSAMPDGFAGIDEAAAAVASYLPHRKRPVRPEGLAKNLRKGPDGRLRWHWDPEFLSVQSDAVENVGRTEERLIAAARAISCPVMLVRGGMSDLVSRELAEEFLSFVPHAEYADVHGAGHMVAGDENDVFIEALSGFMDRLKSDETHGLKGEDA